MTSRTYVPSLQKVAHELCRLVFLAEPVIRRLYPENVALQTALTTALTACSLLGEELEKVRELGD